MTAGNGGQGAASSVSERPDFAGLLLPDTCRLADESAAADPSRSAAHAAVTFSDKVDRIRAANDDLQHTMAVDGKPCGSWSASD